MAVEANTLFAPNGFNGTSYKSILATFAPYYFFKSKGFYLGVVPEGYF